MMVTWLRRSPRDREIARLAVPAFGALAAEPLHLLVDTAIVGQLGTDQLSGLTIAGIVRHRREPPRLSRRRPSPPALHAAPGRGFLCR